MGGAGNENGRRETPTVHFPNLTNGMLLSRKFARPEPVAPR